MSSTFRHRQHQRTSARQNAPEVFSFTHLAHTLSLKLDLILSLSLSLSETLLLCASAISKRKSTESSLINEHKRFLTHPISQMEIYIYTRMYATYTITLHTNTPASVAECFCIYIYVFIAQTSFEHKTHKHILADEWKAH